MFFSFRVAGNHGNKIAQNGMTCCGQIDVSNQKVNKYNRHDDVNNSHYVQSSYHGNNVSKIRRIQVKNAADQQRRHHKKHEAEVCHLLEWIEFIVL